MISQNCPICAKGVISKKFIEAQNPITKETFDLLECDYCKVKRTHPLPDNLSKYHENNIGTNMRTKPPKLHSFLRSCLLNKELGRITKISKPSAFLDIGCGSGDFSLITAKHGFKTFAVDSASTPPPFLEGTDVKYLTIDYDNYNIKGLPQLKGGAVILRHVLEHIRDPYRFMARLLSYGISYYYIVAPNVGSPKIKLFGKNNFHLMPPTHIWHYNSKALALLLERFKIKAVCSGSDAMPTFIPSLYMYLRLHNAKRNVYELFDPRGMISTLSLPLDMMIPKDTIWVLGKL
jgi:hypothetical protein